MAFIKSGNIKVFPCGGRSDAYDPLARLTTEYNLVSIINRLVDKKSFIVSTHEPDYDINGETNTYIINIEGYLFTISGGAQGIITTSLGKTIDLDKGHYIVARIKPKPYGDNIVYQQLSPVEEGVNLSTYDSILDSSNDPESSDFKGISFEQSSNAIEGENTLTLFEYKNNKWVEYENSKIKFKTDSTGARSVTIDDGVI